MLSIDPISFIAWYKRFRVQYCTVLRISSSKLLKVLVLVLVYSYTCKALYVVS